MQVASWRDINKCMVIKIIMIPYISDCSSYILIDTS